MLKRIKGFLFNFVSGQAWQVFRAKNVPLESAFIAVRARAGKMARPYSFIRFLKPFVGRQPREIDGLE
jgi:hypothetical protein